jgi:hypothetical protein
MRAMTMRAAIENVNKSHALARFLTNTLNIRGW